MSACNPAIWELLATLQSEADPQSIDRSSARDEALDAVIDELAKDPTPNQEPIRKRFYSLCRNRLSKHRHRRTLERDQFRASHRRGGSDFGSVLLIPPERTILDQIAYRQLTGLIRTVLPEEEFQILREIAEGHSYADIARVRNMTVSSLKSKAFRVREKVRNSRVWSTLHCGLRR